MESSHGSRVGLPAAATGFEGGSAELDLRGLSELTEDPEPVMQQLVRVIDDGTYCPGFQADTCTIPPSPAFQLPWPTHAVARPSVCFEPQVCDYVGGYTNEAACLFSRWHNKAPC